MNRIKQLKNKLGFKKYFFNTSWMMIDKILRLFLGLFVGVWVARYLGPNDYGLLNFSISFVGLFVAFSKLGLDSIIVRNLVISPEDRDIILGTSLGLRMLGAIVMLLFVYSALQLTSTNSNEKLIVMIIAIGHLFMSFEVIGFYFQAKVQGKYFGLAGTYSLIILTVLRVLFILFRLPLIWFAIAVIIEQLTKILFFILFYRSNNFKLLKWNFNTELGKRLLKDSWPLILSGIVIMIYMKIDQVMIKEILGYDAVGQYAAAVRISETWYFIPSVLAASLFPAIINAKKKGEISYNTKIQDFFYLVVLLGLVIALPVTLLSDWIVNILYGDQYSQTGIVLSIHIWAGIFVSLGVVANKYLLNENLQILSFWRTFSGMIVNVILNMIMIPKHGICGAAVATLISQATASYFFALFHKKTRKIFIMETKALFLLKFFSNGKL